MSVVDVGNAQNWSTSSGDLFHGGNCCLLSLPSSTSDTGLSRLAENEPLISRRMHHLSPDLDACRARPLEKALHETTEGNSSLTVPMGLPPPGVARRSLQDLLEAVRA